ncbi:MULTISPECIES: class III extradiol ring-cleavage dioxygenase [unclassified Paenibacillus]|uniref:DODA-type extradiol aromatic ring-opening family dioxygenase n=1 Tax=unclassified Paenibacillus TaxID=185978 RepID=UPI001AE49148|nr:MULTISPECIES: class III extradiol ring-cleavage dioxygenase [unclassified Paenibacillus]MBP1153885.1 4,5-DOPA dioxygenase extradiol [Paenibacillus sp. PvP091]MBP1170730.1 4,5-DOPA dioxygenase extradiol [Paenibacillus sp. PvR098]MBP2441758.1 4,5-DOPA dioxygenase extradiol [Paenibacillus sp. PvP052]
MYPSFFMAHGTPTLVTENHPYTRFIKNLGRTLPAPAGIVIWSAHWESQTQRISGAARLETIKDFWGFPEELYEWSYPAKGNIMLSLDIQGMLSEDGIHCDIDDQRGLDHGAWSLLSLMYPQADIPIVSMSVNARLVPEEQYRIGKALMDLRRDGYLLIGSGGTTHNLSKLNWTHDKLEAWALTFDEWLAERILVWDLEALFDYERQAPHASLAVPTKEHFAPLLISMGAADEKRKATLLHQQYQYGTLGLNCWMFS